MSVILVDLDAAPENRWANTPPRSVRALVNAAYAELATHFPVAATYAAETLARLWCWQPTYRTYRRELEGLAERTQVDFSKLLLLNLSYDLSSCYIPLPGVFGCTGGISREDSGIVLGRNLDWTFPAVCRRYSTTVRWQRRGRDVAVSVGFPGLIGIISGMNRHGVVMTLNQAFVSRTPLDALPVPWLIRDTLLGSTTAQEACDHLTATAAGAGGFYLVADATEGMLIESTGNRDTIHTEDSAQALIAANHFTHESPTDPVWGDSHHRHQSISRALSRGDSIARALSRAPVLNANTVHQTIFYPEQRTLSLKSWPTATSRTPSRGVLHRL